jgi:uncharacterized protein
MSMAEELKEHGYDREEEYFYKKNRELLEKMRGKLDGQRSDQQQKARQEAHWMKCPKCGASLDEVELLGIKVDQCTQCLGIYFDKGELELLLEAEESKGFLTSLKRLFSGK